MCKDNRRLKILQTLQRPAGRLTGRQAELLDGRIDLESSVVAQTLTPRTEEKTGRHEVGESFLPTVVQGASIQEAILNSSV